MLLNSELALHMLHKRPPFERRLRAFKNFVCRTEGARPLEFQLSLHRQSLEFEPPETPREEETFRFRCGPLDAAKFDER